MIPALLLPNSSLLFYAALGYQLGGMPLGTEYAARWASFSVLYWLPIAWMLGRFAWWRAFAVSLVGYCASLYLVYPMAGARFAPTLKTAGIYFGGHVVFFVLVAGLWWIARRLPKTLLVISILVFLGGIGGPVSLITGTDRYRWPGTPHPLNLVNANLVQLPEGIIVTGKNLHIDNGRIAEWADAATDTSPWEKFDAHGAFVMPGMIDVHTHLDTPLRSLTEPLDFGYLVDAEFSQMADHRRAYLRAGVTTVRDVGGPAQHLFTWRGKIEEHVLLGPRLFAVGRLITSPQGHPVSTIWAAYPYLRAQGAILPANAAELRRALEENDREGPADGVKIVYGTIGRAPTKLTPELLQDAIRWAKEHGKVSIVHVETTEEIADAVNFGADGLEHVASAGELTDALIEKIASKQIFVDPTFGEYAAVLKLSGTPEADRAALLRTSYRVAQKLKTAGARFAIGTDAPLVRYGAGFLNEIDHFHQAGFTNTEILSIATLQNAAYLGQQGKLGCLNVGCSGDLLMVRQNPLSDLKSLSTSVSNVIRDGVLLSRKP